VSDFVEPPTKLGGSKYYLRSDKINFKTGVLRDADPGKGEPESVMVRCNDCQTEIADDMTTFLSLTGQYVTPTFTCPKCRKEKAPWRPVDDLAMGFVLYGTIQSRLKDARARWEHTPVELRDPTPPDVVRGRLTPREEFFQLGIIRQADTQKGEPESVAIKCRFCNMETRDTEPLFVNHNVQYIPALSGVDSCSACKTRRAFTPVDELLKGHCRWEVLVKRLLNL
jgi:hypothetical protein